MSNTWSVWLLPKGADKVYLSDYINIYSNFYDSKKFDPHLTLFGRIDLNPEPFFPFFDEIRLDVKILNVKTLSIKIGKSYFKKLYIPIGYNEKIYALQKKVDSIFTNYKKYKFDPHISLAYGNFTAHKKYNKLISPISKISFSSLAIVHTPDEIENWSIIRKFYSN